MYDVSYFSKLSDAQNWNSADGYDGPVLIVKIIEVENGGPGSSTFDSEIFTIRDGLICANSSGTNLTVTYKLDAAENATLLKSVFVERELSLHSSIV